MCICILQPLHWILWAGIRVTQLSVTGLWQRAWLSDHGFHYTDDILLTSDSLVELEKLVTQVLPHLKFCIWAVNEAKMQRPGPSVKFLRVVWLGKRKVIPDAVIHNILTPTTVKQLQVFVGLLEY